MGEVRNELDRLEALVPTVEVTWIPEIWLPHLEGRTEFEEVEDSPF